MALRTPIAVVNERSLPPFAQQLDIDDAVHVLSRFFSLVKALHKIRPDIALATATPLGALPVTSFGLGFSAIAQSTGGQALDHWRYIQARRNIAPFIAANDLRATPLDEEYRLHQNPCIGLGIAAASGQLAVSFLTDGLWEAEIFTLDRCLLEEDSEGTLLEKFDAVDVRHAALPEHVTSNSSFIADLALPEQFSGTDLWSDRVARYPNLHFLARVEAQLRALQHGGSAVRAVHERLTELSETAAEWHDSQTDSPNWRSTVTPEGEVRKRLCMFTDFNGETRCFDMHARFTPGAGRIHFRLVPELHALSIAHVGRKIDA